MCSSCAGKFSNKKLDLTELEDSESDLGVFVFRPMFFKSMQDVRYFISTGTSNNLSTSNNEVSVHAKAVKAIKEGSWGFGVDLGKYRNNAYKVWTNDDSMSKFIIRPTKKEGLFSPGVPPILKPEYFYHVGMLPEGEYFITTIFCPTGYGQEYLRKLFKKNEKKYHFYIKAGHVNYIGDLYFTGPQQKKKGGFFSFDTYQIKMILADRYQASKDFLREFLPEVKLPIRKSLLYEK